MGFHYSPKSLPDVSRFVALIVNFEGLVESWAPWLSCDYTFFVYTYRYSGSYILVCVLAFVLCKKNILNFVTHSVTNCCQQSVL
jgi:hypothetical protein